MLIKKFLPICFIAMSSALPMIAHADIEVVNNTTSISTAKIGSQCSASYGDAGILKPKSSIVIPQFVINTLCLFSDCEASIYVNDDGCNGKVVGVATINRSRGVIQKRIMDNDYDITGLGNHIEIAAKGNQKRGFMDWLKSFF